MRTPATREQLELLHEHTRNALIAIGKAWRLTVDDATYPLERYHSAAMHAHNCLHNFLGKVRRDLWRLDMSEGRLPNFNVDPSTPPRPSEH